MHVVYFPNLAKRSTEWYKKYHPQIKVDRQDPFAGERKGKKAELEAPVILEVQVPPKQKKVRVEGSSRLGCALNNYLNLKKQNCTDM